MSFDCTGTPVCLPIYTSVVYDFCFQEEDFDLTTTACADAAVPSSVSCTVSVTCALAGTFPAATAGYVLSNWTFSGTVTLTWNCTSDGTITTVTANLPFNFFKQGVILCSPPPGTSLVCESTAQCLPFIDFANNLVGAHVAVCLEFESLAKVKLLVLTYGELTPAECQTGGLLPCPPGPLPPPCDP